MSTAEPVLKRGQRYWVRLYDPDARLRPFELTDYCVDRLDNPISLQFKPMMWVPWHHVYAFQEVSPDEDDIETEILR